MALRLTSEQLRWRVSCALYGFAPTRSVVPAARQALFGLADARDRVAGHKRPWYLPPRRLRFVGGGDHLAVGRGFAEHLRDLAGLEPVSHILDIGCGIGRVAVALTEVLGAEGRYEGFDVVREGIEWCEREIAPRHPSFRFQLADVHNSRYNPSGRSTAEEYRFPYADGSFDVAFAASLFTHMLPGGVAGYLREARRVLRPGGRLFTTWYLLGLKRESAPGPAGDERAWFPSAGDGYRTVSRRAPEYSIAYEAAEMSRLHDLAGLDEVEIHPGRWLGGPGCSTQDIVVASSGASILPPP